MALKLDEICIQIRLFGIDYPRFVMVWDVPRKSTSVSTYLEVWYLMCKNFRIFWRLGELENIICAERIIECSMIVRNSSNTMKKRDACRLK